MPVGAEDDSALRTVVAEGRCVSGTTGSGLGTIPRMSGVSLVTSTERPELGRHVAFVAEDAQVDPSVVGRMATLLDDESGVDVVSADFVVRADRSEVRAFTPEFSPERLRHHCVIGPVLVVRREIAGAADVGEAFSSIHDVALRLSESTDRWRRVPEIAATCQADPTVADVPAIVAHLDRIEAVAEVVDGSVPGTVRVVRPADAARLVSVVIPTRGSSGVVFGTRRVFVVEAVRALIERSTYRALEFVVVADLDTPPDVLDELRGLAGDELVVIDYDRPFNFSDKVNVGVAASSGDLILLLNDDTELIDVDSIGTMVAHLDDTGVAMVGAKLLFEDGTLQHGGHVYNGEVHHACFGWPGTSPGPPPLAPLVVARECSGVTAGCALVRRDVFESVGGFDTSLPLNYNDVDFSLKVRSEGHRILWSPWATWYHFESRTRLPEILPSERAAIDRRWHDQLAHDPYYHPALPPGPADWRPAATSSTVLDAAPTLTARARSFVSRRILRRRPRRPHGVNLIGYLGATSGLGDRARELQAVLDAAGIRYSRWDLDLTESAHGDGLGHARPDDDVIFDTTVAVVTALAFPALPAVYPPLVHEVDRVVGYWFWELADIPERHRPAIELVDEIWAPTMFVRDAYAPVVDVPVELVPLPIRAPQPSGRDRESLGIDDRFTFLTSFDHLSAMQRKHPLGVIDAFGRAFPGRADVALIVKSINGHLRPDQTASLVDAAAHDERVSLRDGYLSDGDQAALIAAADCYVSLHRSEGLGLHIAEAMWLGTPVVATDYSGSVDLTRPTGGGDVVASVPYRLVPVEGGGEAYAEGVWAEPDLDAAADAMRRLADDSAYRSEIVTAARRHVERLAEPEAAAARVRAAFDRASDRSA